MIDLTKTSNAEDIPYGKVFHANSSALDLSVSGDFVSVDSHYGRKWIRVEGGFVNLSMIERKIKVRSGEYTDEIIISSIDEAIALKYIWELSSCRFYNIEYE